MFFILLCGMNIGVLVFYSAFRFRPSEPASYFIIMLFRQNILLFILFIYFLGANKTEISLTDDVMRDVDQIKLMKKYLFYIIYDKHK